MPNRQTNQSTTPAPTVTPASSEELSGAKLKTERDAKPDDQGKAVTLTAPGGTKVTAPERSADALRALGYS